jgi:RNA polymerase sigma-70 factor (ECF subfamily)
MTVIDESDAIVREVLGGGTDRYAELIRLHQDGVWKTVAALLRDDRKSEEMVQEVFVEAYQGLAGYREGGDFGTWVRAIARNRVRRELRSRGRESRRLLAYRERLEERLKDDAGAEKQDDRLGAAFALCRERLPVSAAQALDLRYVESLGLDEIAARTGRTVQAVRQLLFRLRLMLRDCIERKMAGA